MAATTRVEKAAQTRKLMLHTAHGLPDEQAASIPALFLPWRENVHYLQGDRRSYDDTLYKCLQSHTSQSDWTPTSAVSLWVAISDPAEEWPVWMQPLGAHDAYALGSKASYMGERYISNVSGNTWAPPIQWTKA